MDCGLQTTDCGLGIKYGLGIKCGLRTEYKTRTRYKTRTDNKISNILYYLSYLPVNIEGFLINAGKLL